MDNDSYRFMTNILTPAHDRSKYVKTLEKVKFIPDPRIPYLRLFVAMGMVMVIILLYYALFKKSADMIGYVIAPIIISAVCVLALLLIYILPSRSRSMISSVWEMLFFHLMERSRRASLKGRFTTFGIKKIKSGVIFFDNGDFGVMYDVEGQQSRTMLPAVAEGTAQVRLYYLRGRSATSQDTLITSVMRADVESKLNALQEIYDREKDNESELSAWRSYMSEILFNDIDENIGQRQSQIFQTLIIRDSSIEGLKKTRNSFVTACANGTYASAVPLTDNGKIIRRLSGAAMLSDAEAIRQAKEVK
ncbi:hypothetical protein [Corynebacterium mastitidis]|uniref:hypothetical protein n=1 Tax=Corynebacterium mastitidis TaxID=161890 RepID=UPI0012EA444A|nr:hypothetical protein [Corynebacterium mastitidis]